MHTYIPVYDFIRMNMIKAALVLWQLFCPIAANILLGQFMHGNYEEQL